ncbi:hypothetical protein D3874_08980 [Oleomonas cavernae]|uniref:AAA+ ATPase domain-containing protein n=1 Tax=Oleomonas cavernae TaxID=2320859 RepID=A0A418WAR8_9PROT|nr:ATP-binding protein [Oleomonas cavernae]RJF87143.1 hypothetical protein D3874_08980 [Oleomonas cavernae]
MHNRREERAELIRIFEAGVSVQMLAPRRVGKTWLMREVADDLLRNGWEIVFLDVEGMRTEKEFLGALCRKLEQTAGFADQLTRNLKQRLKQFLAGTADGNPIEALGRLDAKDFAEALVAALDDARKPTVILIDEISLFVMERLAQDPDGTKAFLYHLRNLRQSYPGVRWLLTGSIGLDAVARRSGIQGAFLDLEVFALHPFGEAAAASYLADCCSRGLVRKPFALDAEGLAHLAAELGWLSPYYLKLVANRIEPRGENLSGRRRARKEDIDEAFAALLEPVYRSNFAAWEEHIDKNFPAAERLLLHAILDVCCEAVDGEIFDTLFARLRSEHPTISVRLLKDMLCVLANDGFLQDRAGRWRFSSGLLRRYWLRYLHA